MQAFDDSTQGSAAPSTRVLIVAFSPVAGATIDHEISDVATQPFRCRGLEVTVQKSRPTQNKRARERARQEKQQQKTARRMEAASRKASRPPNGGRGGSGHRRHRPRSAAVPLGRRVGRSQGSRGIDRLLLL